MTMIYIYIYEYVNINISIIYIYNHNARPGWSLASQFWSYTPPRKSFFPRGQKMKLPHWWLKTAISDPKFWCFHFFGENFVTPFSTLGLANIKDKGSLPTNSTTRRLIAIAGATVRWRFACVFCYSTSQKKFFSRPLSSIDLHFHFKRSP